MWFLDALLMFMAALTWVKTMYLLHISENDDNYGCFFTRTRDLRPRTLVAGPWATHSYQVNNLYIIPLYYVTILSVSPVRKWVNFKFSSDFQNHIIELNTFSYNTEIGQ